MSREGGNNKQPSFRELVKGDQPQKLVTLVESLMADKAEQQKYSTENNGKPMTQDDAIQIVSGILTNEALNRQTKNTLTNTPKSQRKMDEQGLQDRRTLLAFTEAGLHKAQGEQRPNIALDDSGRPEQDQPSLGQKDYQNMRNETFENSLAKKQYPNGYNADEFKDSKGKVEKAIGKIDTNEKDARGIYEKNDACKTNMANALTEVMFSDASPQTKDLARSNLKQTISKNYKQIPYKTPEQIEAIKAGVQAIPDKDTRLEAFNKFTGIGKEAASNISNKIGELAETEKNIKQDKQINGVANIMMRASGIEEGSDKYSATKQELLTQLKGEDSPLKDGQIDRNVVGKTTEAIKEQTKNYSNMQPEAIAGSMFNKLNDQATGITQQQEQTQAAGVEADKGQATGREQAGLQNNNNAPELKRDAQGTQGKQQEPAKDSEKAQDSKTSKTPDIAKNFSSGDLSALKNVRQKIQLSRSQSASLGQTPSGPAPQLPGNDKGGGRGM